MIERRLHFELRHQAQSAKPTTASVRPNYAALLMSASTVIVTVNALLDRWTYAHPAPARPMSPISSPGQY